MAERQTVIYNARSVHDAHFLRNLLANAQIRALVVDEAVGLRSTDDPAASPVIAQVVVAETDATRARQVAMEFDREGATTAAGPTAEHSPREMPADVPEGWPRCPGCNAPRSTRCPICGTAGSRFEPADMGFVWIPDPDDDAYRRPACSCGPGGCTPAADEAATTDEEPPVAAGEVSEASGDSEAGAESEADERPAELLMCPTCDEPFLPQYPRQCEWCGHEFPEGFEMELPTEPVEQINSRVVAVMAGLLLVAVAMAVYFMLFAY